MITAIYARVSTFGQEPENQLTELRRYVGARGWIGREYVDRGISGAKDRRPALDQLLVDAHRRRFDVLVVWRLDRLSRIAERVRAGLQRARSQGGRLGRPRRRIDPGHLASVAGLPEREAARRLGVPRSTLRRALVQKPAVSTL